MGSDPWATRIATLLPIPVVVYLMIGNKICTCCSLEAPMSHQLVTVGIRPAQAEE